MKCPCCQLPFETQKIAAISFDICNACLGVWIPNQAIKGIVAARAMTSPQFLAKLLERITTIEQDAYTDTLTGLRNRRYFDRQLYAEMARAMGSHYLALILLDLDGFKTANDTHGHSTGDLVLKDFGAIFSRFIRKNDCAARVGGDEFGIILPETDAAGALAIAQRIIDETAKLVFLFLLTHQNVTCLGAIRANSAGLSTEIGMDPRRFRRALEQLEARSMLEMNPKLSFIAFPNWLKYNGPEGPNSVIKGWIAALNLLPDCPEKDRLISRSASYLCRCSEPFRRISITQEIVEAFGLNPETASHMQIGTVL